MKKVFVLSSLFFLIGCSSSKMCTCPGNDGGTCKCAAGSVSVNHVKSKLKKAFAKIAKAFLNF